MIYGNDSRNVQTFERRTIETGSLSATRPLRRQILGYSIANFLQKKDINVRLCKLRPFGQASIPLHVPRSLISRCRPKLVYSVGFHSTGFNTSTEEVNCHWRRRGCTAPPLWWILFRKVSCAIYFNSFLFVALKFGNLLHACCNKMWHHDRVCIARQ